jgi:hypothetical protein
MRDRFVAAMERRAGGHDDAVRRLLEERLSELPRIDAFHAGAPADRTKAATTPAPGPLGELVEQIASRNGAPSSRFPELVALGEFRQLWSAIRAESQLQQSLQPLPANAGPLNSAGLVHRSIALMRELSPGYLQQFLAYVDDLAWMEQLAGSGGWATSETPGATSPGKRPRRKPRV